MAEPTVVALSPARPGSEDVGDAFAAADGHLAGDVAVHPLRPV